MSQVVISHYLFDRVRQRVLDTILDQYPTAEVKCEVNYTGRSTWGNRGQMNLSIKNILSEQGAVKHWADVMPSLFLNNVWIVNKSEECVEYDYVGCVGKPWNVISLLAPNRPLTKEEIQIAIQWTKNAIRQVVERINFKNIAFEAYYNKDFAEKDLLSFHINLEQGNETSEMRKNLYQSISNVISFFDLGLYNNEGPFVSRDILSDPNNCNKAFTLPAFQVRFLVQREKHFQGIPQFSALNSTEQAKAIMTLLPEFFCLSFKKPIEIRVEEEKWILTIFPELFQLGFCQSFVSNFLKIDNPDKHIERAMKIGELEITDLREYGPISIKKVRHESSLETEPVATITLCLKDLDSMIKYALSTGPWTSLDLNEATEVKEPESSSKFEVVTSSEPPAEEKLDLIPQPPPSENNTNVPPEKWSLGEYFLQLGKDMLTSLGAFFNRLWRLIWN